ncbi:hypothetical protein [Pedobacter faecalis]|uniref:hypothetical protein n=1 Tax=Pedobacter faecalis TaxID=3041495 RepID=UPI00254B5C3B|nr:hypothetical protein [Pedobacter sp. ELA7]
MRSILTSILMAAAFTSAAQHQLPGKVHLGIVYPLSTNGTHAPLDTNNLSIHLFAGVSAEEQGPSFAGFSNVVRGNANGAQFAGFSNHIGKKANGGLFAGFLNTSGGGDHAAFAGFGNVATGDMKGLQVAGFVNTARDVNGSQIAGFINVARKVKGAQIAGFVNIADSSDCPIGIINIIRQGEKSVGLTIDENQTLMAGFRSGGKVMYGIIGLGYNFKNDDAVYAFEAGLGAHLLRTPVFRLNTELVSGMLEDFEEGEYFKASFRVMPAVKIGQSIELFAGPALHFISTDTAEGVNLTKRYLKEWNGDWDEDFRALYLGYTAGLHIRF